METRRFGYKYAIVMENGMCIAVQDTTDYVLDRLHIPITDDTINYALKYYYPIPETVTSFSDFQGLFYLDAAHTQPFEEGNAALRHED